MKRHPEINLGDEGNINRYLEKLSQFAAHSFTSGEEVVAAVLELLASELGMRSTFLSLIDRDDSSFVVQAAYNALGGCDITPGATYALEDTY